MTTEVPDPRTFKSWEDAFQYPIPIVGQLERQLRNNADDNREKLRSLVGYGAVERCKVEQAADNCIERATAACSTRRKLS